MFSAHDKDCTVLELASKCRLLFPPCLTRTDLVFMSVIRFDLLEFFQHQETKLIIRSCLKTFIYPLRTQTLGIKKKNEQKTAVSSLIYLPIILGHFDA